MVDVLRYTWLPRFCIELHAESSRRFSREQQRLLPLRSLHVLGRVPAGRPVYEGDQVTPQVVHPLIRQDPLVVSVIYAHDNTTDFLVGLGRVESESLLLNLIDRPRAPKRMQEHSGTGAAWCSGTTSR